MANQLGYLGDMSIRCLLVGGHRIEVGGQLIGGLVKYLISLGLGSDEALYEAFQV